MKKSNVLILCLQLLACMPMALASDYDDDYSELSQKLVDSELRSDARALNFSHRKKNTRQICLKVVSKKNKKNTDLLLEIREVHTKQLANIEGDTTLTKEEKKNKKREVLKRKMAIQKIFSHAKRDRNFK